MKVRRLIFDIKGFFAVHWHLNRRTFLWMGFFILIGVGIGLLTVFSSAVTSAKISKSLIDDNILNAVAQNSGFGKFIFARLFEFSIALIFIFIICLHSWTALLSFAFCAFRAFAIVVNIYWIITKFGILSGLVLLIIYIVVLIVLLVIFAAAVVFIMKQCSQIRSYGFRRGIKWNEFFRVIFIFAIIIFVIAMLEWLIYWLILSKFIFIV